MRFRHARQRGDRAKCYPRSASGRGRMEETRPASGCSGGGYPVAATGWCVRYHNIWWEASRRWARSTSGRGRMEGTRPASGYSGGGYPVAATGWCVRYHNTWWEATKVLRQWTRQAHRPIARANGAGILPAVPGVRPLMQTAVGRMPALPGACPFMQTGAGRMTAIPGARPLMQTGAGGKPAVPGACPYAQIPCWLWSRFMHGIRHRCADHDCSVGRFEAGVSCLSHTHARRQAPETIARSARLKTGNGRMYRKSTT
jgi:hypothetical protein